MGKLYDDCQYLMREIELRGLDRYKARGALTLETGFLISTLQPDEPDDPVKIQLLRDAATKHLGIEIPF